MTTAVWGTHHPSTHPHPTATATAAPNHCQKARTTQKARTHLQHDGHCVGQLLRVLQLLQPGLHPGHQVVSIVHWGDSLQGGAGTRSWVGTASLRSVGGRAQATAAPGHPPLDRCFAACKGAASRLLGRDGDLHMLLPSWWEGAHMQGIAPLHARAPAHLISLGSPARPAAASASWRCLAGSGCQG